MSYDLSVIQERFLKDYPELANRLESIDMLYRQYMYLCAIKPKNISLGVPSDEVDKFWHSHIIHTQLYQKFCKKNISGDFIHHAPHSRATSLQEKKIAQQNLFNLFSIHFKDSLSRLGKSSSCGPNCTVDCSDNCSTCSDNCAGGGSCDSN
ncbi:hypothetical protein [Kamptonema formosum]|uniref:hypothetical protein n=1 Tax=Kamptonema formosum TaxID=331992 RepID=UPI0012DED91B|nr:hypothetical protein [Oscillatoria sp. PCC 10802]